MSSIWFKNITAFKLPADLPLDHDTLAKALADDAVASKPPGPTEQASVGFVSPYPQDTAEGLVHTASGGSLFALQTHTRMLPASVVRDAMQVRIAEYRERMQRTPGKRVRDQLKDEVLLDLLPRAFIKKARIHAYIDPTSGYLLVDTTSARNGELVVSQLRKALGTFTAEPLATEESIPGTLTGWLLAGKCTEAFALGDSCVLKDPLDTRCAIKATKHDLADAEVIEHARSGKRVAEIGLSFDNRLSFVLTESGSIRKLAFLDLVQEELGDVSGDDLIAEYDARATLMVLELRRLFAALHAVLRLV